MVGKLIKRDSLGRRTDRFKKREVDQMLRLSAQGLTNAEIAKELRRKPQTIKRHLDARNWDGHKPYQETPHKQKMRELVGEVTTVVSLPLAFCSSFIQHHSDWGFAGSNFVANISEIGEVEVPYEFEGYLYEGMCSHLKTGGFSDIPDKIADWKTRFPKVLLETQKLVKMVKKDVEDKRNYYIQIGSEVPFGYTSSFVTTVCDCAIEGTKVLDISLYSAEFSAVYYRGYKIHNGLTTDSLHCYRDYHIEMIKKYSKHELTKQISEQLKRLREIEKDIKRQLVKFKEMERLPGWCDLCS